MSLRNLFNIFGCLPTDRQENASTSVSNLESDSDSNSPIRPLGMDELFILSQTIIADDKNLKVDFVHPYKEIVNLIDVNHSPHLMILNVDNHWLSFLTCRTNETTIEYYLIESFVEEMGTALKVFDKLKKLLTHQHSTMDNKFKINFNLIHTGHQANEQSCGFCVLLYLERLANALKSGETDLTLDNLKNILLRGTDGDNIEEREKFIIAQSSRFINMINGDLNNNDDSGFRLGV